MWWPGGACEIVWERCMRGKNGRGSSWLRRAPEEGRHRADIHAPDRSLRKGKGIDFPHHESNHTAYSARMLPPAQAVVADSKSSTSGASTLPSDLFGQLFFISRQQRSSRLPRSSWLW